MEPFHLQSFEKKGITSVSFEDKEKILLYSEKEISSIVIYTSISINDPEFYLLLKKNNFLHYFSIPLPESTTLPNFVSSKIEKSIFSSQSSISNILLSFEKILRRNRIMILTTLSKQGLGYYSLYLSNFLKRDVEKSVFIFSYYPYESELLPEEEYSPFIDGVYQSFNIREKFTTHELLNFIKEYRVGVCYILEPTLSIFDKIKILKANGVETIAIPNIEISKRDEISKYPSLFDKILSPTMQCYDVLSSALSGSRKIEYFPQHEILSSKEEILFCRNKNDVKFLLIGGNNIIRKNVLKILKVFVHPEISSRNITLRVTLSDFFPEVHSLLNKKSGVVVTYYPLSKEEVLREYSLCDVAVCLSHCEGIGLNLYESTRCNRRVITFDSPPFNEVIFHDKNGWLLPSHTIKNKENEKSLVPYLDFKEEELLERVIHIYDEYVT